MNEKLNCNEEIQVVESRKEALKNRKNREKERKEKQITEANNIVNLVCNIFKVSDKSEQGKLVWHVRLQAYNKYKKNCKKVRCFVCFTEDIAAFYGVSDNGSMLYSKQYKEVLDAIKIVNAIETTEDILEKAISYFICMTNFKVSRNALNSDITTITLKSTNL